MQIWRASLTPPSGDSESVQKVSAKKFMFCGFPLPRLSAGVHVANVCDAFPHVRTAVDTFISEPFAIGPVRFS